ncbi:MAG: transglycosylase SLT domain-containing protein [Deltaproteobacteria bacterium]|nr:transglycosylase SLT domain-containing protein [Deltaproteobacteria bacterium]
MVSVPQRLLAPVSLGLLGLCLGATGPARAGPESVRLEAAELVPAPSDAWAGADPALQGWLEVRALREALAAPGRAPAGLAARIQALPAGHPAKVGLVVAWVERHLASPPAPATLEEGLSLVGDALGTEPELEAEPPLRVAYARLLEAAGRGPEARHQRLTLLRRGPASAEGLAATAADPTLPSALEPAAQVDRLAALVAANHSALAIPEALRLRASLEPGGEVACRLSLILGKAHRLERNYREAIDELEAYGERCPQRADQVLEAEWLRASAASIALRDPAIPLYQRLIERHPDDPRIDDALFFIADLHLLAGRDDEAARVLETILAEHPQGNFALKAAWRLARRWLRVGRPGKAMVALKRYEKLAARRASGFDLRRARYFQALTLLSRGGSKGRAAALRLLRQVIDEGPLTFHGSFARALLREHAPAEAAARDRRLLATPRPPGTFPPQTVSRDFLEGEAVRVGRRLLALGLEAEAREVLGEIPRRGLKGPEVLVLAGLLARAGGVREAQLLLRATRAGRAALGKRPTRRNLWVWQTAYPRAYRSLIEAACAPVAVPPDLVQAIIREESALDPGARSWAGAVGLAQLMPTTAGDTGRRMGLPEPVTAERLLDPELNLRVSCRYLSDLRSQVGEALPLMVAAYNGGGRSVQGWQEERGELPLVLFLETMGYAETRRYTRRVLETLAAYRFLYGADGERLFLPDAPARSE